MCFGISQRELTLGLGGGAETRIGAGQDKYEPGNNLSSTREGSRIANGMHGRAGHLHSHSNTSYLRCQRKTESVKI